jgi:hypothetical protein
MVEVQSTLTWPFSTSPVSSDNFPLPCNTYLYSFVPRTIISYCLVP